jgi:hypothetical protein
MSWRLIPILVLLAAPAAAETPIAEVVCLPKGELKLRMRGAEVVGAGLRDAETVLEVWAGPTGDWTLVQVHATGLACILAMGESWETVMPPPA